MNEYIRKKVTLRQRRERIRRLMLSTTFRIVLVVAIAAFGFLYVVQINSSSAKAYTISDLEQNILDLERENRRVDVEISKHRSIQSIQGRLSGTDMVAVGTVEYLTSVGSVVAQR